MQQSNKKIKSKNNFFDTHRWAKLMKCCFCFKSKYFYWTLIFIYGKTWKKILTPLGKSLTPHWKSIFCFHRRLSRSFEACREKASEREMRAPPCVWGRCLRTSRPFPLSCHACQKKRVKWELRPSCLRWGLLSEISWGSRDCGRDVPTPILPPLKKWDKKWSLATHDRHLTKERVSSKNWLFSARFQFLASAILFSLNCWWGN